MELLWYYLLSGLDPYGGGGYAQPDPYGGYYPPQSPYYPQGGYYPPQPQYAPGYPPGYYPPQPPQYAPMQPGYTGATLPSIQVQPQPQLPPVQPWPGTVPTQPGGRVAPPYIPPGSPGTSYSPGTALPAYRPQPVGLPQPMGYPVPPRVTAVQPTTYDSISGQIPRCSNIPPGYVGRCV